MHFATGGAVEAARLPLPHCGISSSRYSFAKSGRSLLGKSAE